MKQHSRVAAVGVLLFGAMLSGCLRAGVVKVEVAVSHTYLTEAFFNELPRLGDDLGGRWNAERTPGKQEYETWLSEKPNTPFGTGFIFGGGDRFYYWVARVYARSEKIEFEFVDTTSDYGLRGKLSPRGEQLAALGIQRLKARFGDGNVHVE